jgi:hypothetical protein
LSRILTWLDDHLVDDWRSARKWWSVKAAAVAGLVVAILTDPNTMLMAVQLLYAMPPEYRWFVPWTIGLAVAAIPIVLRVWKQRG